MKRATALSVCINAVLALIILAVGAVCFFPAGDMPAGNIEERVCYRGSGDGGRISLMFNVYGGEEYLPSILDTLDVFGVKATFFIGGCWADDHTKTLRTIVSRGHEAGNHGYFHKVQDKLSLAANKEEIARCHALVKALTGTEMQLFAPPSGAYNDNTLSAAAYLGLRTIMWSRDTIDWRDSDTSLIYSRATKNLSSGEFVLMHPMDVTVAALPDILSYIKSNGMALVTVSQNIGE